MLNNFEFGSWGIGVYLDRWSFVHFAWGFMLAALLRMLGFSRKWAYVIALILMIGWEFAEWYIGPANPVQNTITDILAASTGFWLSHYLWKNVRFMTDALVATTIIGLTFVVKMIAG